MNVPINDYSDDEEDLAAFAVLLLLGAVETDERCRQRRNQTRAYLCHPQLLPNPCENTPWQALYAGRSDRAFITCMGFDCAMFDKILEDGFAMEWDTTSIPRPDTRTHGTPRLGRRSLDCAKALALVLHYLSSTMPATSLQLIFALIPTTVSRYINFALQIILQVLRQMPEAAIVWPDALQIVENNTLIVARHPLLTGAFGSCDGLRLPVETSTDADIENATFNGWAHDHSVNSVLCLSPRGTVILAILNAPGSWHDAKVARAVYQKLRTATPEGFYLVADTAFPRGAQAVEGRIKAPLKAGQRLPADAEEREELLRFDRQLLSYRQTAEWGMRALQGSFGRLRLPMDINDHQGRMELLEVCVRLNNLRANCVGISEIRNVYEPIWQHKDDGLWFQFEHMLFKDIRRLDRVSRFHNVPTA